MPEQQHFVSSIVPCASPQGPSFLCRSYGWLWSFGKCASRTGSPHV